MTQTHFTSQNLVITVILTWHERTLSPSINVHCEVWHKRKLMSQILSRFSLGSHHSIIQPDKQLSLRTAKITQRAALTSCLWLQISCHFHIHFSVTAYVWESVRVLWGAGVAALQACQHLPLLLTPPGDAAIQKCPSVLLPPPARSMCVCLYLAQIHTHLQCEYTAGLFVVCCCRLIPACL